MENGTLVYRQPDLFLLLLFFFSSPLLSLATAANLSAVSFWLSLAPFETKGQNSDRSTTARSTTRRRLKLLIRSSSEEEIGQEEGTEERAKEKLGATLNL